MKPKASNAARRIGVRENSGTVPHALGKRENVAKTQHAATR
jgi:hypothetical protein